MPPLHHMDPPPHPFWDFVADMDNHPWFRGGPPPPGHHHGPPPPPEPHQPATQSEPQMSEKSKGKQPTVEDPPEVDPASLNPEANSSRQARCAGKRDGLPFRGRGRCGGGDEDAERQREMHERQHEWRERCRRGRGGWGGGHRGGPPPFMMGQPFFAGPRFNHGPPHHHGHHHGPPTEHVRGHCRRASPPHQRGPGGPGFDLGAFLNRLGERLGVDLAGAAEGLGLDRFSGDRANQDADFEPRSDIFENKEQYTIHLSLPGAKKQDVGVDWDGENSVLRVAGVVHRPGADEQMLSELIVDGRKRETGVFEKAIRLGTKNDPASIDVTGINAKMTDGVLVVRVPKVDVVHEKREVPIDRSQSPSPHANERSTVFDADQEMYETVSETPVQDLMDQDYLEEKVADVPHRDAASRTLSPEPKEKEASKDKEAAQEQLPAYQAEAVHGESDWEKYSDEEEGEYVKINVD